MAHPRAPRFTLKVDAETIAESCERDSSHCMIAESVRVSFPNAKRISVDLQTIRFSDADKGLRYTYLTPRTAQIALIDFDQGRPPEPFEVRLSGGMVTRAGTLPHVQQARATKRKGNPDGLAKARLVSPTTAHKIANSVPNRVGGKTPPLARFARIRAFGLRGLDR